MMKNAVNEKTVNDQIDKTIKQWAKSHKARLDDTVANYGYYYEGGPTPEYDEIDYEFEQLDKGRAQLNHFISELQYTIDRVNNALSIIK